MHCSMLRMKCTGADSGAGTGSGAMHGEQFAVCSVKCPACHWQKCVTSSVISFTEM